jgi:uncharacterized membrane protein (DUF2068 family)
VTAPPISRPEDAPVIAPDERQRLPVGVIFVAFLRFLDAAGLLLVALFQAPLESGLPLFTNPQIAAVVEVALAIMTIIGAIGLLLRTRWGWVMTMLLVGINLLIGLIDVAIGEPRFIVLLIHVVTAFYLNQRSVRSMAASVLHEPASTHA